MAVSYRKVYAYTVDSLCDGKAQCDSTFQSLCESAEMQSLFNE